MTSNTTPIFFGTAASNKIPSSIPVRIDRVSRFKLSLRDILQSNQLLGRLSCIRSNNSGKTIFFSRSKNLELFIHSLFTRGYKIGSGIGNSEKSILLNLESRSTFPERSVWVLLKQSTRPAKACKTRVNNTQDIRITS